jgi:hypothetical protein
MIAGPEAFGKVYFIMDVATIEREALALTLAERALLADRLLQTLDSENPERMERWGREADRRLQAFERGEMAAMDGPEAVAAIRRRLE